MDAIAVLAATAVALFISSAAGYGGSLVLVPALSLILGPREGIALAALLLAVNNVVKVGVYRQTLALREGWPLVAVTAVGVLLGSTVLLVVPEGWLVVGIIAMAVVSLAAEVVGDRVALRGVAGAKRRSAVPLMAASSVLSGASGSSGPLKGLSIRHLGLPRLEHVGLASVVSLVGDVMKTGVFASAGILPELSPAVLAASLPMMPLAAWAGWRFNAAVGEQTFRWVFWGVVGGYGLRLAGAWT